MRGVFANPLRRFALEGQHSPYGRGSFDDESGAALVSERRGGELSVENRAQDSARFLWVPLERVLELPDAGAGLGFHAAYLELHGFGRRFDRPHPRVERIQLVLAFAQPGDERLGLGFWRLRDHVDDVRDLRAQIVRLRLELRQIFLRSLRSLCQPPAHLFERIEHELVGEDVRLYPIDDAGVYALDRATMTIGADRVAAIVSVGARIDLDRLGAVAAADYGEGAAAHAAFGETAQKIRRRASALLSFDDFSARGFFRAHLRVRCGPKIFADDPKMRNVDAHNIMRVAFDPNLSTLTVSLLHTVPLDDADVSRAPKNGEQRRWRPRARATLASPRRGNTAGVERLRDRAEPFAARIACEDLDNDRGLFGIDHVLHVLASLAVHDLDIVVAVHSATDIEPLACLNEKVLVRALCDLLALELGSEIARRHHELGDGVIELNLLAGEVVIETRPRIEHVLNQQRHANHVAAETRLVTRNDDIDLLVFDRAEKSDQPGRFANSARLTPLSMKTCSAASV